MATKLLNSEVLNYQYFSTQILGSENPLPFLLGHPVVVGHLNVAGLPVGSALPVLRRPLRLWPTCLSLTRGASFVRSWGRIFEWGCSVHYWEDLVVTDPG